PSGCATLPPIDRRLVAVDKGRDQLDRPEVAELPQLLGGPRVLKEDMVDLEGVQLTRLETVGGLTDPFYELRQLGLVVGTDDLSCSSPLRLARHASRLPWCSRQQTYTKAQSRSDSRQSRTSVAVLHAAEECVPRAATSSVDLRISSWPGF